jgi:hypothetical protein
VRFVAHPLDGGSKSDVFRGVRYIPRKRRFASTCTPHAGDATSATRVHNEHRTIAPGDPQRALGATILQSVRGAGCLALTDRSQESVRDANPLPNKFYNLIVTTEA